MKHMAQSVRQLRVSLPNATVRHLEQKIESREARRETWSTPLGGGGDGLINNADQVIS